MKPHIYKWVANNKEKLKEMKRQHALNYYAKNKDAICEKRKKERIDKQIFKIQAKIIIKMLVKNLKQIFMNFLFLKKLYDFLKFLFLIIFSTANINEQSIKSKKELLLEKRKYLEENVKENHFLENVRNDYQKYHDFILKQKQDQIKSMQFLNQYIDDLMISGKLTEHDIVNSKREKQEIMSEVDKIKKDLDGLMKN